MQTATPVESGRSETFDRTVFMSALVVVASGVVVLVTMLELFFPEWFAFLSRAGEAPTPPAPPVQVVRLRPVTVLGNEQSAVGAPLEESQPRAVDHAAKDIVPMIAPPTIVLSRGSQGRAEVFARDAGSLGGDPAPSSGLEGIDTTLGRTLTLPDVLGGAPGLGSPAAGLPAGTVSAPAGAGVSAAAGAAQAAGSAAAGAAADAKGAADQKANDAKDAVDAKAKDLGVKVP